MNEIGGPVRTPYGYHVIKAIAIRALLNPAEASKGRLRQQLRRTRLNAEMQRWVEELKERPSSTSDWRNKPLAATRHASFGEFRRGRYGTIPQRIR